MPHVLVSAGVSARGWSADDLSVIPLNRWGADPTDISDTASVPEVVAWLVAHPEAWALRRTGNATTWGFRNRCVLTGVAAPAWVGEMEVGSTVTVEEGTCTGLSSIRDSYGPGALAAGSVVRRLSAREWEVLGVGAGHA